MTLIIPPATATSCPLPPPHETIHLLDPRPALAGDRRTDDFPDMKTTKPPTIRPGQRRPYVKGTLAQIDQRRGFVARMLDDGATKTEIHSAVRQRFNIEWRQTDRYIDFVTAQIQGSRAPAQTSSQTALNDYYQELIKMYQDARKQ